MVIEIKSSGVGVNSGRSRLRSGDTAFTMVEIALCLAIIGFAMVAIIGVLPLGVRVQKDNREETIINQDGTFLIEAIRSGSRGIDYLTNFVVTITRSNQQGVTIYTNAPDIGQLSLTGNVTLDGSLTNGLRIVELLTTPKYVPFGANFFSNHVSGYMRALSGSAVTRSRVSRDFAFAYHFTSEMVPFSAYPRELTNFVAAQAAGSSADVVATQSNLWNLARQQVANFNELRLTLQGPVIQRGRIFEVLGTPKTFRTLLSGTVSSSNLLIQPSTFVQR
jgi:type II secretory pathway pseudopilin PulG